MGGAGVYGAAHRTELSGSPMPIPSAGSGHSRDSRRRSAGLLAILPILAVLGALLLPIAPVGGMSDETYVRLMTGALKVLKALGRR